MSFSALQRAEIAEIQFAGSGAGISRPVSVLFNEPKLLKFSPSQGLLMLWDVSVLFNEPKLLKSTRRDGLLRAQYVSVLFNEPKLLKSNADGACTGRHWVSVLFNEPKLLKFERSVAAIETYLLSFSALQRAEIAEIQ